MTQYAVRFECTGTTDGRHWAQPTEETLRTSLTFAADAVGNLVAPVPELVDVEIVDVILGPFDNSAAPWLRAHAGGRIATNLQTPDAWWAEAAASQAWQDNVTLDWEQAVIPISLVELAYPVIKLGGAFLASFTTPPTTAEAVIRYRPRYSSVVEKSRGWFSHQQGIGFVDTEASPPESLGTPTEFLLRLERSMSTVGGSTSFPISSGTFTLNNCAFATPDPRWSCWIAPGDIGVAPGQIPPNASANTAERYRAHPAAFWAQDRAAVARVWEVMADRGEADISTRAGALLLYVVSSEVSGSRWMFVIDGAEWIVRLNHGDLRRPRDIWNQVIVPSIARPAIAQGPEFFRDIVVVPDRFYAPIGRIQDLTRLQYARFLEPLFATTTGAGAVLTIQDP